VDGGASDTNPAGRPGAIAGGEVFGRWIGDGSTVAHVGGEDRRRLDILLAKLWRIPPDIGQAKDG